MKENFTELLIFYSGDGVDHRGRKIEDIWSWNYGKLEQVHDFIQWIFPLNESSAYNSNAPILTAEEIDFFRDNKILKNRLLKSFDLILGFYGYTRNKYKENTDIFKSSDCEVRINEWVTPHNHNFLRITRILKSLSLLGLSTYAESFLNVLEELYSEKKHIIGLVTFEYWKSAIEKT